MKTTLKIVLILVIIAAIWLAVRIIDSVSSNASRENEVEVTNEAPLATGIETYSSQDIYFEYPARYFLEEKTINSAERGHKQVVLTLDTEENRLVRQGNTPPREGPTAITIDIFQNDLDKQSLMQFVTGTNDSNYKLGAGKVSTTTIGNLTGLEYFWSGLYEGRSFVASNDKNIYHFAVTFMSYEDDIIEDFQTIVSSAELK